MLQNVLRNAPPTRESAGFWMREADLWRRRSRIRAGRDRQAALERLWWAEARVREIRSRRGEEVRT